MLISTANTLIYKVVFIGDSGVGKTSIVQRIKTSKFDGNFDSTIGASAITKEIQTPQGMITLNIWDTAGQERYRSLIQTYARNASAAVICFDLTSLQSFQSLNSWVADIRNICDVNCRIIIVGNKSDLEQCVSISLISEWCEDSHFRCIITSAKTGVGIDQLLTAMAEEVLLAQQEDNKKLNNVNPVPNEQSESSCCWKQK